MKRNGEAKSAAGSSFARVGTKAAILIVLTAAVSGTLYLKNTESAPAAPDSVQAAPAAASAAAETQPLPRLVDLGADKCIPCKMMAPILEELKTEYKGKFEVEFIDVWKNPEAGEKHKVQMIPTQIFLDASGKELFRHSGFLGKEDILNKWKELGVKIAEAAGQ